MRIFGYIFLIGGFIWLLAGALFVGPVSREVVLRHYDDLPKQASFTREQTEKAIRDVALDLYHRSPRIVLPALVMLWGGILLDVSRRGKKCKDRAA